MGACLLGRGASGGLGHALVAQQGVQGRCPAPEGLEGLHGWAAAADFQDGLAVARTGFRARQAVGAGGFLESGIGVGAQHFRPLVAVVAGRVAAREDMAERVRAAAEGRRLQHGDFLAYLVEQGHEVLRGIVLGVQQHVEQRELDLPQRGHAALEVLGGQHLVEKLAGQRGAGVHVGGHVPQHVPLPAEVLHELAGQLHRVPLDAADAGHVALVHLREHVVQPVAELVEEGDHVVVREQRRLALHACGEVADQVGDRRLQPTGVRAQPARAHAIHPGAAALAGAGRLVQVELADEFGSALDAVELHGGVPDRSGVATDGHVEERLDDLEEAGQHLRRGEVLLHLLLAESVARFLELFGNVGPVPGLRVGDAQVFRGEIAQVGHVLFRVGPCSPGEIAQEIDDLPGRVRHLGDDGHLAEIRVAQQPGLFLAQGEDFADQCGIVEAAGIALGLVRSPGDVGAVQRFAQCAALGELHHGQIAGHLEGELIALPAVRLGGGERCLAHILGQSGEFILAGVVGEGVGGVQGVLAELLRQFRLPLLDLGEALLGLALQLGAGEHEIADSVLPGLALFRIERGRVDGLVLRVEALVGSQACPELRHPRQDLVVCRSQLGRVGDAVQVADVAPCPAQLLDRHVQHARDGFPGSGEVRGRDGVQRGVRAREQGIHRGSHVGGRDTVEQREVLEVEEWVAHARSDGGGDDGFKRRAQSLR